jgi:plasmid stability protein
MKHLTVREVPDEVYAAIKEQAGENHRSIQEQVRYVLEKEARLRRGGFLEAAHTWRRKVAGRALGDSAADVRAGRERR